jgi:two-component system chemotaxis response regulator CheY
MAMAQPLLTYSLTMRVLIVEDTDSVRFALRLAMEYLGHEVVGVANDGQEALEEYQRVQPEVVLMDVRMPRMDGLTCTSLLAKQYPNVRVVIVTGGRTSEHEAREAGALGFVEKPFEVEQLGRLIRSLAPA